MGSLDNTRALNELDSDLAVATKVAATSPMRSRLMTAIGSQSTNGTELATGGGYTAGASAPSVTFGAAALVSGVPTSANSTAVSITNMPASTIRGIEAWDSAATPKRWHQGPLTANVTVNAGDTFLIPIGSWTIAYQ